MSLRKFRPGLINTVPGAGSVCRVHVVCVRDHERKMVVAVPPAGQHREALAVHDGVVPDVGQISGMSSQAPRSIGCWATPLATSQISCILVS